jgi:cytochrome P450
MMSDQADPIGIDERHIQHAHQAQSELRDSPPRRVSYLGGMQRWLVTRHEDVKSLMSDPRISRDWDELGELMSEGSGHDPYEGYGWMYRNVPYLDPPDHTRLRRLVSRAFTSKAVEWLRPRIEEIADGLLSQIADRGSPSQGEVDLVAADAAPLPTAVISELIGIPHADRPEPAAAGRGRAVRRCHPQARRAGPGVVPGSAEELMEDFAAVARAGADELIIGLDSGSASADELLDQAWLLLDAATHAGLR